MRTTLFSSTIGDVAVDLAFINNPGATRDPGANDDSTQGYTPGSTWINTATKTSFTMISNAPGAAVWIATGQNEATIFFTQTAPTAVTVSGVLTPAALLDGIITINQGAAAPSAQQLPTGADMDAALTALLGAAAPINTAWDVSVMNISVVDAEDASVTANGAGFSVVGNMDFPAKNNAAAQGCTGLIRCRKTAADTFVAYRIS